MTMGWRYMMVGWHRGYVVYAHVNDYGMWTAELRFHYA